MVSKMAEQLKERRTTKQKVNAFLFAWHRFAIDYWWRKKYGVAFGSPQHREMNFIDMYIEYQEEILLNKEILRGELEDETELDKELGIETDESNRRTVDVSPQEIDEDYDKLDLSEFDKT